MTKKLELLFGALCPSLSEQIVAAGLILPSDIDMMQQDADEISRLYVRSLLTESEANRARKRLMVRITCSVRKENGGHGGE